MKRKSLFVILSIVIFGFIILQRPQANFACAASNTVNSIKTNAKAAYSVTFDKISLPSLKRLVEFSTQIKNTTNLQYYFNL